ncbi:MAG: amidohydrolase family protein [Ignavibacterium sp.]|nr:amidohydrolase family protein [Ignavibacterium sp.]
MNILDIHTHGAGGFDTRTKNPGDILSIAEVHGRSGVSAIIPTIYSSAIPIMRSHMESVRKAMHIQNEYRKIKGAGRDVKNSRPSKIIGVYLEGPFLNPSKCGALDASSFIRPQKSSLINLIEGFEDIIKIITVAPEISGALSLIRNIADSGITVSMGHSDATYSEAEAGFNAGAKGITHLFNAMRGFHHREPGIAGFGLINKSVYVEVIADRFHLHPETLEMIFRTKMRDRIILVSDTVKESQVPLQHLSFPSSVGSPLHITKRRNKGVTDSSGRLLGGSMMVTETAIRLIEMGYDEDVIMNCITKNPQKYLST